MDPWTTTATALELAWVVTLVVGLLLERRSPVATLAWIFALLFLPWVGIVVYYVLGPRRLARKKLRRVRSQRLLRDALTRIEDQADDPHTGQLARMAVRVGESAPLRAVEVELYTEGDPCFAAIEAAIAGAKHHAHLEYYIWDHDTTGKRLLELLVKKRREGVEVRLLLDGVGAYALPPSATRALELAGGEVAWFNPVTFFRFNPRYANFRTHRKIVVVDGEIGFTGGMNVTDDQSRAAKGELAWRDTHVRMTGPVVRALQRVFLEDWAFATDAAPPMTPEYLPPITPRGEHMVQIVSSGPDQDAYGIHKLHFAAIAGANQRVWITSPYFVPDEPVLTALTTAALRGVDVRVLVPSKGDSRLVDYAARSYFQDLLRVGVRIWEYQPRFVHAKTMVIDDALAVVGTANLDNRSFRLNFEVCAAIYDAGITQRLAAAFEDDLAHAKQLAPRTLKREPFVQRVGEAAARVFSPLL